jgi:heme exporter protein D
MSGVIEGGWEFVWAAYGITAAVFVLYGISLAVRLRAIREGRKK